jgi:hypothetical protein
MRIYFCLCLWVRKFTQKVRQEERKEEKNEMKYLYISRTIFIYRVLNLKVDRILI